MKKEYYSIPEIAKMLGISRIAVYNKVRNGSIKAIRSGRSFMIPKDYVDEILGNSISEKGREIIDKAVKKAVNDYGETLKKLGTE
ncbi:MAG: helix-turn-helix domain-containing protein [Endomicrobiales bacterium]|nr:helix-turn-helix domain-containing protein [Endomicrobiales bacterium]